MTVYEWVCICICVWVNECVSQWVCEWMCICVCESVYECAWMSVYVCESEGVCICVWGYLFRHVCVEGTGWFLSSSSALLLVYWYWNLLLRLAGRSFNPGLSLSPPHPQNSFHMAAGIQTFTLMWQVLYSLSHLPAPQNWLKSEDPPRFWAQFLLQCTKRLPGSTGEQWKISNQFGLLLCTFYPRILFLWTQSSSKCKVWMANSRVHLYLIFTVALRSKNSELGGLRQIYNTSTWEAEVECH